MNMQDIKLKTKEEIDIMIACGRITAIVLNTLKNIIRPNVTTLYLDKVASNIIRRYGGEPAFLGYDEYGFSIYASVNSGIVEGHESPSAMPNEYRIREGDLVMVDVGVRYNGFYTDSAFTMSVGNVCKERRLLNVAEKALFEGIKASKPGNRISDITTAIESCAKNAADFNIVKIFGGHGIGRDLYEEPIIPNTYDPNIPDYELEPGMTFTIEPTICSGEYTYKIGPDVYKASSNSPAAMFEHTIAITKDGHYVLTI